MNFNRFFHTSSRIFNKNARKTELKPRKRWLKWGSILTVTVGGLWFGDLIINDDLDIITDRFRTKISEEERKNRFVYTFSSTFL